MAHPENWRNAVPTNGGAPSKLCLGGRVQDRVGRSSCYPTPAAKDAARVGHPGVVCCAPVKGCGLPGAQVRGTWGNHFLWLIQRPGSRATGEESLRPALLAEAELRLSLLIQNPTLAESPDGLSSILYIGFDLLFLSTGKSK